MLIKQLLELAQTLRCLGLLLYANFWKAQIELTQVKHSLVADTRAVDLKCSIALLQLSLSFLTVDHSFAALAMLLVLHTCSNTEGNKLEISFGIAVILVFDSCCYGKYMYAILEEIPLGCYFGSVTRAT